MKVHRDLDSIKGFQNAVITIGSYDGLHVGHRTILDRISKLAQECNGESVVITFHPHPRQIVYPSDTTLKLLNTIEEKIHLLEQTKIDHLVIVPFTIEFSQIHPREYVENFLIKKFNPRYIVIGYDHRFGLNREGDINLLRSYTHDQLDITEIQKQEIDSLAISSTKIRKFIQDGLIAEANKLLGTSYLLQGTVVHGEKIGKTIGFPTANIKTKNTAKLIPCEGIYAVRIEIDETLHDGMLYIGKKPTINNDLEQVIEVNIFEFDQNIYSRDIIIYFIDFIRDDQKFDNLEELKIALAADKLKVQKLFESFHYSKSNAEVTIAILNYNGATYLESYMPSVEQSYNGRSDILIIDNNSTDDSIDYIMEWHPGVRVIKHAANHGFAEGYNLGLESIESEYCVILNSDVEVSPNWLEPILTAMNEDLSIGCMAPKIKSLEDPTSFEYAGAAGGYLDKYAYPFCRGRIFDTVEKDKGQYDDSHEIFWASGAAMVVRTSLFKKLGGFDKDFFAHMEEIDFCWRIKRAGYKIMFCPEAVIYHLGGGTLDYSSSRKVYLNFRNNLNMLIKNESHSLWPKFILRLILDGIAGLKFLFSGKASSFVAVIKAHFSVYGSLFNTLQKRKEIISMIKEERIDRENKVGRYSGSIVYQYYIANKKIFSSIIKSKT